MIDIDLRDVEKIIEKKEKEGTTFNEAVRNFYSQDETETMRKYAEVHGCGVVAKNATTYERPLPCVRDEHGYIRDQTVKKLFAKIDEELNEFKAVVLREVTTRNNLDDICDSVDDDTDTDIVDEAADVITAITTLLEALCFNAEMRDEAQRRVNNKNRSRGRL